MRRDAQRDGRIDARDFFHDDRVIDVIVTEAPQSLGQNAPEPAQAPQVAENVDRKMLRFVPLHYVRTNFSFREIANRFAELILFGCVGEIQSLKRSPVWRDPSGRCVPADSFRPACARRWTRATPARRGYWASRRREWNRRNSACARAEDEPCARSFRFPRAD